LVLARKKSHIPAVSACFLLSKGETSKFLYFPISGRSNKLYFCLFKFVPPALSLIGLVNTFVHVGGKPDTNNRFVLGTKNHPHFCSNKLVQGLFSFPSFGACGKLIFFLLALQIASILINKNNGKVIWSWACFKIGPFLPWRLLTPTNISTKILIQKKEKKRNFASPCNCFGQIRFTSFPEVLLTGPFREFSLLRGMIYAGFLKEF